MFRTVIDRRLPRKELELDESLGTVSGDSTSGARVAFCHGLDPERQLETPSQDDLTSFSYV